MKAAELLERVIVVSILRAATPDLPENLSQVLNLAPAGFTSQPVGEVAAGVRELIAAEEEINIVNLSRQLGPLFTTDLQALYAEESSALSLDCANSDAVELLHSLRVNVSRDKLKQVLKEPSRAPTLLPDIIALWNGAHVRTNSWLDLVCDGADIQRRDIPAIVEIVQGILPEHSKLSIVSSAKAFKTWTTIYLAVSVSQGCNFLGRPTQRRRVLYVNLELKPRTFERRVQAIARALEIEIDSAWFYHLPLRGHMAGLSVHEVVSRIIAVAKQFKADVVVCDPVFKLNTEGEENSSRDQTVFFNELDRLTTEIPASVVLNDHTTKGNQSEKEPLDVIRGSSAKGGDLDAAMVLRKHKVAGCFSVDMVHRELPPVDPFVIGWQYPLMRLRQDLDAAEMKKAKAGRKSDQDPEELCAAISGSTQENPASVSEWAEKLGIKRTTLNDYLPGLRVKGWIMTVGEGRKARKYLTEKGQAAADRWRKSA